MDTPHALEPDDVPAPAPQPRRWLRYLPLALVGVALVAAILMGAPKYLSLETLREQRALLLAFVEAHPIQSIALYVAVYTLVVALSLPGALAMTLTGGFLFGTLEGAAAAVVGVTAGAMAMFLVARSALGHIIHSRFPEGGRVRRLEAKIQENAFTYIFTLRLLPVMPLWLVNIAAGFVRMPLRTYFLATFLGIIPATAVYASIGAGLGHVFDAGQPINASLALDPQLAGPILALVVLMVLPFGVHLYRRRRALPRAPG